MRPNQSARQAQLSLRSKRGFLARPPRCLAPSHLIQRHPRQTAAGIAPMRQPRRPRWPTAMAPRSKHLPRAFRDCQPWLHLPPKHRSCQSTARVPRRPPPVAVAPALHGRHPMKRIRHADPTEPPPKYPAVSLGVPIDGYHSDPTDRWTTPRRPRRQPTPERIARDAAANHRPILPVRPLHGACTPIDPA